MAFQLTPLRIPSLTTDYSAETQAASSLADSIGNIIPNIRKQQEADQKRAVLGKLAEGGDFTKAGLGLFALGDTTAGASLLQLGQTAKKQALEQEASKSFLGALGGAPSAGTAGPASLIQNESGGNWQAQNNAIGAGGQQGHFGRAQFGQARLQEAAAAGAIPQGTTPQAFMASPELQQRAEQWHFADIDNFIRQNGYDRAVGQSIGGVPVTVDGMRAVAHLGGKEGLKRFIETGGRYNPADANGTRLSDYFARHGGGGGQPQQRPVQVAETEADVQRLEQAQQPVQVAQAPAQPGAPVADMPAQGATPAQFAVPQSDIPPGDLLPNVPTRALLQAVANPNLPDNQRQLAKTVLDSRTAANKPTDVQRNYEQARRQGYQGSLLDYQKELRTQINNTNTNQFDAKGETKFNEALGSAQAKRWNDYIAEGDVAQGRLADIQTLRETSRRLGSQGSQANLKALIGPYAESLGIQVEGLPDIQLYESITQRLAPQLRAAGSGSTSDIEFKGFQRAIGPLSNNPAAREMILDTFEAASRNDIVRSEIGSRLAAGEINRGQAEKELRALPNPLEAFREFRKANPDLVGQAIKEAGMRNAAEKRDPVKVTTPDEARKLPSGTRIILPDGSPGVVP